MVEIKLSALKETKPHQYLVRFLFGGAATVLAGLVARRFGPAAGGLFLAFPAIFPASVTLIESHEKELKNLATTELAVVAWPPASTHPGPPSAPSASQDSQSFSGGFFRAKIPGW